MLDHYLHLINEYMQARPYFGELFAFLIAFAESLPLLGTIIPGSITMTIIGILVGRNLIPLPSTLFWATLGAFAGDAIGFWLGKFFNERIRGIWPFRKHPKLLTLGEAFFHKHGGKSILIGRFVGPARSTVPLIAGLLKLNWARFIFAAIPSAFLWAVAYLLPGVLVGAISLELPKGKTTEFMLIALAIIVVLWLIFWAIQRFFVYLASLCNRIIDRCWNYLNRHHQSQLIIRTITNQYQPLDHHQLTLIILSMLSFLLFCLLIVVVTCTQVNTIVNEPFFHLLQSIRTIHGNQIMLWFTLLGDKRILLISGIIIAIGLAAHRQWRTFVHLVLILFFSVAAIGLFKHLIYSPRPVGFMITDLGSSFPSGHTTLSLCLFGFLAYFSAQQFIKKWHWIPYTLAALVILCISFSRLYLGGHWLTDILGAWCLGFTILLFMIMSYRRQQMDKPNKVYWLSLISIGVIAPWLVGGYYLFPQQQYRYTPYWPEIQLPIEQWWQHPTDYLPHYRLNRFGRVVQPFNIQWSGTLNTIVTHLHLRGWQVSKHHNTMKTTIGRFASYKPEKHMPFFAPLYRHQPPVVLMIKHLRHSETIIELRLWKTGIKFTDSPLPLWIGTIDYHTPVRKLMNLDKSSQINLRQGGGIEELSQHLKNFEWKVVTIPHENQPKRIHHLKWDGSILIIRRNDHNQPLNAANLLPSSFRTENNPPHVCLMPPNHHKTSRNPTH